MANDNLLLKIKTALRITHTKLDEDIQSDIDACLADLEVCGVQFAPTSDPLIYNAVKLWCRSLYTDDQVKAAAYMDRYEKLKACLMIAEGYGWEDGADE